MKFLLLCTVLNCFALTQTEVNTKSSPYFGEPTPMDQAVIFSPGLISKKGRYEFAVSFSPDGNELLFTTYTPGSPYTIMHSKKVSNQWGTPVPVKLAPEKKEEMEAFFSPDGRTIFFAPYDQGMDVQIWAVDRASNTWNQPRKLPFNQNPAFFPTCSLNQTLYFTDLKRKSICRVKLEEGTYKTVEPLALPFAGHPFIAPDESFLLLDGRGKANDTKMDIYVSFPEKNGNWSEPIQLGQGVNTEFSESCPSLSHDGKYLFFSRYCEEGDISDIYWVSSDVIVKAKIRSTIAGTIAWAKNKDLEKFYGSINHSPNYISVHPQDDVAFGFEEVRKAERFWMDPRFKHVGYKMKDVRINLSQSKEVAWWYCVLDDLNEWEGKPVNWENTRWTGVLEKQGDNWIVQQMHFSFPKGSK